MIIELAPVACPRPRVTRSGRVYYPVKYREWVKEMKERLSDVYVPDGPIIVEITFVIQRPQRLGAGEREYHDKRPDIDNLVKSVLDALPIDDDARVVKIIADKFYASSDEGPSIELMIQNAPIYTTI